MLLHQAVTELAIRCDGAHEQDDRGFNKPDSHLGKFMAAVPVEIWSGEMARTAWLMLKKYESQLASYGIEYGDIAEPAEVEGASHIAKKLVDFQSGRFVVKFDYDPALVSAVKDIDGRRFNPPDKTWLVPPYSHEQLTKFTSANGFLMSQAALDALASIETYLTPKPAEPRLIKFASGLFSLYFSRDDVGTRNAVKEIDGRRFDPDSKCWTVPHSSAEALETIAGDFDVTPEAQEAFQNAPVPYRVEIDGDTFRVFFPYAPELTGAIKDVTGRRFVKQPAHWTAPVTSALELVTFLASGDFNVSPEAQAAIDAAIAGQAANLEQSRAADAEVEISGLGGELRPFQRAGAAYAARNRRTFIADEMGLGKTIQALATIQATNAYPALIVCPASLKLNWAKEARKWLPGKTVEVVNGKSASGYTADITIINYDILADGWENQKKRQVRLSSHSEALKARDLRALVLDESHYAKSGTAQRTAACKALAQDVETVLLLTGTPLLNRPSELIAQLDIMGRLNDLGGFWNFAKRYCNAYRDTFGWNMSGAAHLDELNEKLRSMCFIRRNKADVLKELPPKQRSQVYLEIDNRTEYARATEDLIGWLREQVQADKTFLASIADLPAEEQKRAKADRASEAAAKAQKAEQLVRVNKLKRLAAQGKLKAVIEWVSNFLESGEKLVLFAYHVDVVKAMAAHFNAPAIMGETPIEQRQAAVDRFQNDPDCNLIVGNLEAMGVGLTLTAASNVAFVELGWTPALHDQSEDRVHRIGQESGSVNAWYLLAERTIDEQIAALIERKRAVVSAATEGVAVAQASILNELIDTLLEVERD